MVSVNETKSDGFIELRFNPVWDYIPFVREYIRNVVTLYYKEPRSVEQITLAVSEVLENAVKYSVKSDVRMILERLGNTLPVKLCVYNYAEPAHGQCLIETVEEMKTVEPLEFYIHKMKLSVKQDSGRANIGLARIYYESEGLIAAGYVDEGLMEVSVVFNEVRGGSRHA